jgi:hypothetical protein
LVASGFGAEWVYADGRTKEQLIENGRLVAEGAMVLNDAGVPVLPEG